MAISNSEKVRIASDFILQTPPGEFKEVFNDVRILVSDDDLLTTSEAFGQYNKDQLTPITLDGLTEAAKYSCLVTDYNDLGQGRYGDPRTKHSFHYDHLRKEASDPQPWQPEPQLENTRAKIEEEGTKYMLNHYTHSSARNRRSAKPETGSCGVFSKGQAAIIACIENHQFQPKDFW